MKTHLPETPRMVVFDLDGTLIDSRPDLASATNTVLSRMGYPTHTEATYGDFMGNGLRNLVCRALPEQARTEAEIERCRKAVSEQYGQNCMVRTLVYPGIGKVLDFLSAQAIKIAVLSNKPHEITEKIIGGLFPSRHFFKVQGAKPGIALKPAPEALLQICREAGVGPRETLYVGDSEVDIATARNAGITCLCATWGYRTREVLCASGAEILIEKAEEIIDICSNPRN